MQVTEESKDIADDLTQQKQSKDTADELSLTFDSLMCDSAPSRQW